ncbi:MAG: Holliday junction resolvase RecU [Erysipelotrichaceae bacterium]|nr:Holliday junction resolvase RecU [Erysipelotrichaceae bacterium]
MMRYPNGKKYQVKNQVKETSSTNRRTLLSAANRGMSLEEDINSSNEYYKERGMALITKRPTPINIVKVDYSRGARITDAYFEKQSTTDYNGVYRSRYLDFEAKNTKSNSAFPLSNISRHQVEHLRNVINQGGIAFFIICFQLKNEIYLLDASFVIEYFEKGGRKSIPYQVFKEKGVLIRQNFNPRLHYIEAVDELYFR